MAQFEQHFVQDLTQPIKVRHCGTIVFNADDESNVISVRLFNGSEPVAISGSVVGAVVCSDGSTVTLSGSYSGNTASITLTGDCFAILGQIGVGIQIVNGTQKTTVLKAIYNVEIFTTENVVDPGSRITLEVGDLIDDIETAVASIPADYSDLLAAIAPNYSGLTFPVKAGTFCWYDGTLYQAQQDIATSEAWTAAHWASSVLTTSLDEKLADVDDELGDLKSAVSSMNTATAEDEGKALKAKTVEDGVVTEWEFGEAGGVIIDDTLTQSGEAADAKATGCAIEQVGETAKKPVLLSRSWKGTTGYYYKSGHSSQYTWHNDPYHKTTEQILVGNATHVYVYTCVSTANASLIQFADGNGTVFADYGVGASSSTTPTLVDCPIPSGAVYVSYTSYVNQAGQSFIYFGTGAITLDTRLTQIENLVRTSIVLDVKLIEQGAFYRDGTILSTTTYRLSDYVPCAVGDEFVVMSMGVGTTQYQRAYYDSQKNLLCYDEFGTGANSFQTIVSTVNIANAAYVRFCTYGTVLNVTRNTLAVKNTDAVGVLQFNVDAIGAAAQLPLKKLANASTSDNVTLLHFSDIHGDAAALKNIQIVKDKLSKVIDDAICSGDMIANNWSNSFDFWDECDGSILTCIGNHEVLQSGSSDYRTQPTEEQIYNRYMAPYIGNWGTVQHSNTDLFYYKDYATKKLRLIVLNALYPTDESRAAQITFLTNALAGAKTAGYTVVIAEHYYPNAPLMVQSNFTSVVNAPAGTMDEKYANFVSEYQAAVQTFIDGGGDFACYLCGHRHADYLAYTETYPKQLFIGVGCALCPTNMGMSEYAVGADARRMPMTKSMDCMNLISFDSNMHYIKIVRVGVNSDLYLRPRNTLVLDYSTSPATVIYSN